MKHRFGTRLVHNPGGIDPHTGSVTPPVYLVSTFKQDRIDKRQAYDYSRTGNPTRTVLEDTIADLEGAGDNGRCLSFASGMSAITASVMLLKQGDHLIATEDLYGGSYRLLTGLLPDFGIQCTFVDTSDLEQVEAAVKPNTRAVFFESPTNPLLKIADIRGLAELAKSHGLISMVDNTFMTPYWQRPIELGIDLVIHSATKYLGGHSDLLLGLVTTADQELGKRLKFLQNTIGAVPGPLDCWLVLRGLKTLRARLDLQADSAAKVAAWLTAQSEVKRVFYPGLESHPGAGLHGSQASSAGGMLTVEFHRPETADALLHNVKLWTLGVSLGAVESLITSPMRMTHATFPRETLEKLGITEQIVRLSVGIEETEDLIADLDQALKSSS